MPNDNFFLKNKKSSLTDNQKRGEIHLAFAVYKNRQKPAFDANAFNRRNQRKL